MRILVAAALGAFLLAGQAMAQTEPAAPTPPAPPAPPAVSECGTMTEAPTIPDGATARQADVQRANEAYQAWGQASLQVLTCRREEVDALQARRESLAQQYNEMNQRLRDTTAALEAAVAAFNERNQRRR